MNNNNLISKLGAAIAVICILFMPIFHGPGANINGLELLQNERVPSLLKMFILISIGAGILVFIFKNRYHVTISAIGGIVSLFISYVIVRDKSQRSELDIGAFIAIIGYLLPIVTSFMKSNNLGNNSATTFSKQNLSDLSKKCPNCAEEIKLEAQSCRFCQHKFSEEEINKQISRITHQQAATTSVIGIENESAISLDRAITYLRGLPQKTWQTIIIISGIVTAFYGIIGGLIAFFIWKPIDNVFAKKLLKISFIFWIVWIIGLGITSLGWDYYEQYQWKKTIEKQRENEEIVGDPEPPSQSEIPSATPRIELSSKNAESTGLPIFFTHHYSGIIGTLNIQLQLIRQKEKLSGSYRLQNKVYSLKGVIYSNGKFFMNESNGSKPTGNWKGYFSTNSEIIGEWNKVIGNQKVTLYLTLQK